MKLNIIFFGNGPRGKKCLEELIEFGFRISAVVGHEGASSVIQTAKQNNIPIFQPNKVNEPNFVNKLRDYSPDLFVLAGYNQILKNDLISIPRYGTLNLHGGKLPEYRGVAPINWQIINGETKGGCCIIIVDEGIDTGDIVEQVYYDIGENETAEDIINKQLEIFPSMLINAIEDIERGKIARVKQNLNDGAYYTRRYPKDGRINWETMTAQQIHNLIRALNGPYPPAFCNYNDAVYKFHKSRMLNETIIGYPGRIALRHKDGTIIIAKDKGLLITEISTQNDGAPCSLKTFKLGENVE